MRGNLKSKRQNGPAGESWRPNFVFILADDLGYADLGCYGGRDPHSPNLDRMAAEGLVFTNGYANSSVCSPTRMALATGRWQHRLRGGADEPIASVSPELGLPPEHPTLASLLRGAGYSTALIGKWHLGGLPHFSPMKSGYDEFFGFRGGAVDYFRHRHIGGDAKHDLWEADEEVHRSGYLTDLLSDRAVSYIRNHAGKPFFLDLHYNAPHWPWEAREDELESRRIKDIAHNDGGSLKTYLRMLHHMDEGIGRVLAALDEIHARDNTFIVFTSDNGGERFSDMWPLMGKKMDLLEGGIRVPYIARWPAGHVAAGETTPKLAITMDWVATFLSAAGVSADPEYPLDGIDLLNDDRERNLYWRMKYREQKAVRSRNWKYLSIEGNEFLFDLERDSRERANMRFREPKRFEELRTAYRAWDASLPPIHPDATVTLVSGPDTLAHAS